MPNLLLQGIVQGLGVGIALFFLRKCESFFRNHRFTLWRIRELYWAKIKGSMQKRKCAPYRARQEKQANHA